MLGGCCGPRILPLYGDVFFEPILMNPVDLAVGHGCPSELRRATGPILSGTCGAWCWMTKNHGACSVWPISVLNFSDSSNLPVVFGRSYMQQMCFVVTKWCYDVLCWCPLGKGQVMSGCRSHYPGGRYELRKQGLEALLHG